jgi:hypothetical protein
MYIRVGPGFIQLLHCDQQDLLCCMKPIIYKQLLFCEYGIVLLKSREELRLKAFYDRMLGRIFWFWRDEINGDRR